MLEQPRDVVEFPLEGDIDVGGWDLRKALLLALNGNAVVVEWAKSPFVYREQQAFRQRFVSLLDEIVDPARVARHYLGLARSHLSRAGNFSGDVRLNKLFYLIRPIVALDWMEARDFRQLPPMNMVRCLDELRLPEAAEVDIRSLVEAKRKVREIGVGPVPDALAHYIGARYGHHELHAPSHDIGDDLRANRRAAAERFYQGVIEGDAASVIGSPGGGRNIGRARSV